MRDGYLSVIEVLKQLKEAEIGSVSDSQSFAEQAIRLRQHRIREE